MRPTPQLDKVIKAFLAKEEHHEKYIYTREGGSCGSGNRGEIRRAIWHIHVGIPLAVMDNDGITCINPGHGRLNTESLKTAAKRIVQLVEEHESARATPMTEDPCLRCLALARKGEIRIEAVQRLPKGAFAPMGMDKKKCCFDCQSADNVLRVIPATPGFAAARVAVANDRQGQYRLPGVPLGLVGQNLVRPSKEGDLDRQHDWLNRNDWFGVRQPDDD